MKSVRLRTFFLPLGTMGKEKAPAIMEVPQAGCLYSVECDGTFRKRDEKIDLSNGLAWTADDRTMFFIDSTPYYIYAYDFDIATGNASEYCKPQLSCCTVCLHRKFSYIYLSTFWVLLVCTRFKIDFMGKYCIRLFSIDVTYIGIV